MDWFRRHVRLGSHLALLALAIQLALTFSHVHLGSTAQAHEYFKSAAVNGGGGPTPPKLPAANHASLCAVCTLLQLAASLVCSEAPALAPPQQFNLTPPTAQIILSMAGTSHLPFNARAPPAV
jgi:hypothetical protein